MKTRKSMESTTRTLTKKKEESKDSWIFLANRECLQSKDDKSSDEPKIVRLKHPQTGQPTLFLFSADKSKIQEIQTFTEDKRCWFVNNDVIPDGQLHLATPIDPLFLILPYLKEAHRCSPLDQVIIDEEFPEIEYTLMCSELKYIDQIADRRGDESLNAYIYNKNKTLTWLEKKVERIASVLESKNIHVASGSVVSVNFKSTTKPASKESYIKYAHGIISEYLPADLSKDLAEHLKIPVETTEVNNKRKKTIDTIVIDDDQDVKRVKVDEDAADMQPEVIEEIKPKKAVKVEPVKKSAKEKSMAKAATGTKSISSFFKKV